MPRARVDEWPKMMDYTCPRDLCADDGTYAMRITCGNCDYAFIGRFTRGHEAIGRHECPRCGCDEARADQWVSETGTR